MSTANNEQQMVTMGVRLTKSQREGLNEIARRQFNTTGGIIRLAIQQLIENEGSAKRALNGSRKLAKAA